VLTHADITAVVESAAIDNLSVMKEMMRENTAQLVSSLGPMLAGLLETQQAIKDRENAQKVEDALDEAAAREAEEFKAHEDLRKALEQSREQARVDAVMPPSILRPDAEARPRGGAQRVDLRTAMAELLRANTGDLTEEEVTQFHSVLTRNAQVPPSPVVPVVVAPLSVWGVEAAGRATRSAPALFSHLQEHGLAPPTASEEVLRSLMSVFKKAGDKEAKKAADISSFVEFVEFMRESKVRTREYHDIEPDAYWAMDWHFQSVVFIFCNDGWPAAGEYNRRVMKEWQDGYLDVDAMAMSEEHRRGNVEGALHQRAYLASLHQMGTTKAATASGKGVWVDRKGYESKRVPTDTYCDYHELHYAQGAKHSSTTCQAKKTSASSAARAKKKK